MADGLQVGAAIPSGASIGAPTSALFKSADDPREFAPAISTEPQVGMPIPEGASVGTPPPQAPSTAPPPKPSDGPQTLGDTMRNYWSTIGDNLMNKSVVELASPMVPAALNTLDQVGKKIIDHEVIHGNPIRAQIASAYVGSMEDVTKLARSATTPANTALMLATSGESLGARLLSRAANLYFAYRGSQALLEERQANETAADEIQRRALGAAQAAMGMGGELASLKDSLRSIIQRKLGLSGDLATTVTAKVQQEHAIRQQAVADVTGVEKATAARESTVTGEQQQIEQRQGEIQQDIPNRLGKIIADAQHSVVIEHAKVKAPFEEIGRKISTPVTDNVSVKSTIMDTLKDHGVQEHEVPNKIFAAMKPVQAIEGAEGFPPAVQERLQQETAQPVTFNDLTRVRDDLWQAANTAKDPAMRSGLFDSVNKVTKMQESFAEQNNLGPQYKAAKQGYFKFMRELGSGTMAEFLHAGEMQDQNMNVRLKDITTGSTASTLRNMLKIAGVDIKPMDDLLSEQETLSERSKAAPKDIKEIQTEGRTAAAGIHEKMEGDIKALGENNSIIPGRSDLAFKGKTNEQIRREAMDHLAANAKKAGMPNPGGYIMLAYGLFKMALGSPFGAMSAGYGASRVAAADLARNPAFQDWMIRESGVEPSNKLLIGKMRKSISSMYPALRKAAQSAAVAGALNRMNQRVQ